MKIKTFENSLSRVWLAFFVILLAIGIFFRFANLEYKTYWHDEVYTSMRAAGYTRQEIDQEIFDNRIIAAGELQKFQRIKPQSTAVDTIRSLATEDPQHPPFYFLIARFWMQMFGSSLTASRSLPALLSLLGLPLMYKLGLELFDSRLAAVVAATLYALSPFDILFAQTARQYSLLTVVVIASSLSLLLALRKATWHYWLVYSITSAVGLYTHPFFGLTLIAHGVYVLLLSLQLNFSSSRFQISSILWHYLLAMIVTLGLYSPWLFVLATNYQQALATTDWARISVDVIYLTKLWTLSFSSLFFDLDFGFNNIQTYLPRALIIILIVAGIYQVCRKTNPKTWLFILTTIFVPFLILAVPDLLLGGKRSAVTRYLISCFPGVQLAVAFLLADRLLVGQWIWRGIMVLLFTGSIASCTVSAFSDTWWSKDLSYFNPIVAKAINAETNQPIISEIGDDFTNTGDLISLSYMLRQDTPMYLLKQPFNSQLLQAYSAPLVFRPSQQLCQVFEQKQIRLEAVFKPGRLWRLRRFLSRSKGLNASKMLSCSDLQGQSESKD
ncbi:MAG: glycosyltransferase family 39 protein [Coleofasciculaceae cyanobacterium]